MPILRTKRSLMSNLTWNQYQSIAFPGSPPFWRGVCGCGYMTIPHDDEPTEAQQQVLCPECKDVRAGTDPITSTKDALRRNSKNGEQE